MTLYLIALALASALAADAALDVWRASRARQWRAVRRVAR